MKTLKHQKENVFHKYIASFFSKGLAYAFAIIILLSSTKVQSQNTVLFKGSSLKPGDSCTVVIQTSSREYFQKKLIAGSDGTVNHTFTNLQNGKWGVRVDATGYYFPSTKVIELKGGSTTVEVKFTPIILTNNTDYLYEWNDDSSYLGHAQQSYINDPPKWKLLNDSLKIPDDFSSVNLLQQHGIILSDTEMGWTREDAYRLYQMVRKVPTLHIGNTALGATYSTEVRSVWTITNSFISDDVQVNTQGAIKYVRVSREAFKYAAPLIAELDGIKGRFYSKRLYQAVVNFATDFGRNIDAVSVIARERFGVKFLDPGSELQSVMNENAGNFQSFSPFEKLTIMSMLEEMPDGMRIQSNLKYLVRRIAGQDNPVYPAAAAIAWTSKGTIEFMQKAFNTPDYGAIQRLILHEKAHFLWAGLFSQSLKDDWIKLGGWYQDPSVASGWSTTNTTEFVSAYAHANNPDEDMAETIATYITNPSLLQSRSLRKFEFIRDRVMHGTRWISIIRPDLTFMVYNLYPDYNYPGKILSVKVNVTGAPEDDKNVTIELRINALDSARDGASSAYTRIFSSIGTMYDVGFSPVDGNKFHLRGRVTISKFAKSGYWTVNQIMLTDEVGNQRYENNNTFGLKIFVNNPNEDLFPPRYMDRTLKLDKGVSKFSSFAPAEDPNGKEMQYVQGTYDVREKNALDYLGLNFAYPTDIQNVNKEMQFGVLGNNPKYLLRDQVDKEITHVTYRYPIPEYLSSGWYKVTQILMKDVAQNFSRATFMLDTAGYQVQPDQTKHIRDSIFITTKYPDYIHPVLDVNDIFIRATPTNPTAPDGETLFEMEFFAKDSSAFKGNEAGMKNGYYVLRDPQGKQFGYSMQGDFNKQFKMDFFYQLEDPEKKPGEWRKYKVSTLLPKGSAPGLWGVESISLFDRADNRKDYSFVELVRFDIEEVDSSQKLFPKVEILGKKVNANNVDSVSMYISCKGSKGKLYRVRFYSDMGGSSVVKEGIMTSDSIILNKVSLSGVNDGTLFATVFILDTSRVLLGIGKASYAKDVVIPKSALLQTNLSDFGKSNIDSLIVKMRVYETRGSYSVTLKQLRLNNPSELPGDSITLNGIATDSVVTLSRQSLSGFRDGVIQLSTVFFDSVGNASVATSANLYKDTKAPLLTMKRVSTNGRRTNVTLTDNEFIRNIPFSSDFKVLNGVIQSIVRKDTRTYDLSIDRSCNDTLVIDLFAGRLYDTVGNSNESATFTSVESIVPEVKVSPVAPTIVSGNSVTLTASGAQTYTWNPSTGLNESTGTVVVASPTTTTDYSVIGRDANGCLDTLEFKVTVTIPTGTLNLGNGQYIKVFPNPNRGILYFDFAVNTLNRLNAAIIDLAGREVVRLKSISSGQSINLDRLPTGTYILILTTDKGKVLFKEKIMVQK